MFEDKTLVCKECGSEFIFTAGEQEFYASKGFENEPQRCKACRDARKAFSSPRTVINRGFASLGRTSPLMWGLFWGMNLRLGEEIDQKMNVPIGENLDELPK